MGAWLRTRRKLAVTTSRRVERARCGWARAASRGGVVEYAESDVGHGRRLAAVGGRLPGRLGSGVRGDALAYDASDDVWQGTFSLPAGSYEYKAALNDSWDENYGLHARCGGANIPLASPRPPVKFYYDHKSHWVTDNKSSVIAVAAGSFQSELGCPGDWDRTACARGSRTRTATAPTRSRRRRCRPARTRRRSRSTRAGTRTTARAASPGGVEHPVHGAGRQREGRPSATSPRRTC